MAKEKLYARLVIRFILYIYIFLVSCKVTPFFLKLIFPINNIEVNCIFFCEVRMKPPCIFTDETVMGRKLLALTEAGIAAICAHTNLDAVAEGVNDALAETLGLTEIAQLKQDGVDGQGRPYGIGRIGLLSTGYVTCAQFARKVKELLGSNGVRYVDSGKPVRIVAVGGGSCSDMMDDALAQGCDTFVTADVKYDGFLDAKAKGLNLIDAGHYPTENVICPILADWLSERFPEVETAISEEHHEVFDYL